MNPLRRLAEHGQSAWLDGLRRSLVAGGGLRRPVVDDGLKGVTSNPAVFEKAIGEGACDEEVLATKRTGHFLDFRRLFAYILE